MVGLNLSQSIFFPKYSENCSVPPFPAQRTLYTYLTALEGLCWTTLQGIPSRCLCWNTPSTVPWHCVLDATRQCWAQLFVALLLKQEADGGMLLQLSNVVALLQGSVGWNRHLFPTFLSPSHAFGFTKILLTQSQSESCCWHGGIENNVS